MLGGAKAPFLSLLLKRIIKIYWDNSINLNLIFTMEKVIVMKDSIIDVVLNVNSCSRSKPFAKINFRISGRL